MTDAPGWVTLTDDEEVLWRGRPTVVAYLRRFVTPVLLVVVGVAILAVATDSVGLGVSLPAWLPAGTIGLLFVVAGLLVAGWVVIQWRSVSYLLTSEEVYRKQGVVSRRVQNLRLDQIQNTSFTQTVLGRLASHGDIHIETAGSHGAEITFEDVPDPQRVLGYITEALDRQAS